MIICMATSPINPVESYTSLCRILGSQSVAIKSTYVYNLLGSKTTYLDFTNLLLHFLMLDQI
jgi:hypothetical protein